MAIVPSSALRTRLPVKPSQTTTSAAPSSRLRLSVLPLKLRSLSSASSRCASSVNWFPFSASSPIESSRTSGSLTPRISRAKTEPMCANWRRCSARPSALAPESIRTEGPPLAGRTTAIPGRLTPRSRRISSSPAASMAPVFPAETAAWARPSRTSRHVTTSELSRLARTASAGFSSIATVVGASTSSSPPVSRPGGGTSAGVIAGNDLFRGAIAPHRIDRDSNHGSGPRAQTDRRQSLRS